MENINRETIQLKEFECGICKKLFKSINSENKFCSKSCLNHYNLIEEFNKPHECLLCKYIN